jgi:hypothetical protein
MRKQAILIIVILATCYLKASCQNNPPVAIDDTVRGLLGYPVYVTNSFLIKNDYDPDGDSIHVRRVAGHLPINDTTFRIMLYNEYQGTFYDSVIIKTYWLQDEHGANNYEGRVVILLNAHALCDSLNINNINALISPFGNHFWGFNMNKFEVPKGSGKTPLFNHTLWVGGLDSAAQLHLAAERYRQTGKDYFAGPISNTYDSTYDLYWNRLWKLNKTDIQNHLNNWNKPGYEPIDAIKNWPAHGDTLLGQPTSIAPFFDSDLDGRYNPYLGDYPLIRGDQCIYFIFNDARSIHTESKGEQLGIEIRGMAYEYDFPNDSLLYNTLFMHYDVVNLSLFSYHDAFLGLNVDFDMGAYYDDFMGCDVTNGMMYAYNGDSIDGEGEPWAYGEHPPAIGLKIIGGPFLQPDGIDNPSGDCTYSLNGLNFGDGVADNERMGMTNFMNFHNINGYPPYMEDPQLAINYYNLLQSKWSESQHLVYGLNGHPGPTHSVIECNYMFPGNSDTLCNWGTHGILPYAPYYQDGFYWTEATTLNTPSDRHGVASIGPFNFNAGQSVPLDYCFTFARDYTGNNISSMELLRERISSFATDFKSVIRLPETNEGLKEQNSIEQLKIFPNPTANILNIQFPGSVFQPYQIYSINGLLLVNGKLEPGNNRLVIGNLAPGVYLLKCGNLFARVIKMQ